MNDLTLKYAKELLTHLENYLNQTKGETQKSDWISDFSRWINSSVDKENITEAHAGSGMEDILIGMHLVNMSNLLKKEQNRFAAETPFSSFMDFQYLFVLNEHGDMTKSRLIFSNNMEMSSGVEVVNRLNRQGWIGEKENPEDRRSKLVSLSEKGRRTLEEYKERGLDIYKTCSAGLGEREKLSLLDLLGLLSRLNS
ncbi:MAG: MarR family transcriptional regulator [Spirochaetales bacterium]|nr:MarR family transcriptional regulator [Spirochaetales bacterium]